MEKQEDKEKSTKQEEITEKEKRIRKTCLFYYSRKDIQKAILDFSSKREVVPRYFEGFGKRPDMLQYPSDILNLVKKGATSFHCSEEIWNNPLEISTELSEQQLNEIRQGWDLLIDIDSKYLDYSKIAASLIIEALEFHGIKNYSAKFSGSKGFHIIVPWKAFPLILGENETRKMFPEWPRAILLYLNKFIEKKLIEKIGKITSIDKQYEAASKYIKGEDEVGDAVKKVIPDIILVSSRHLFRAPYSLHEKTSLSSVVLSKEEIFDFQPKDADPLKIKIKSFYPEAKEGEARELLIQALDYIKQETKEKSRQVQDFNRKFKDIKIDKRNLKNPPCVEKILKGLDDGRKRGLFILMNYFRSLNFERQEIEKIIEEWNKKNKQKLKEGYIKSQFDWQYRQKQLMPPNCRDWYKGIGVCFPDSLCEKIKNPVNYAIKKSFRK